MIKVSRGGGLEVSVLGEILSNIKDNQKEVSESHKGGRNTDMGMVPRGIFLCVERSLRILSEKNSGSRSKPRNMRIFISLSSCPDSHTFYVYL